MALYDFYAHSIAGLQRSQALIDWASGVIANPATWGFGSSEGEASGSFREILAAEASDLANSDSGQNGRDNGDDDVLPVSDSWGTRQSPPASEGGSDLLDAMVTMIIAARMYEANARLIAIEDKLVGILINIGE